LTGYIGLGSNVGDRLAHLRAAREGLERRDIRVLAASMVYETEPVGEVLEQRDFLNACVEVATELTPDALLERCKELEQELGRRAGGARHGPRLIDVDILLLDGIERADGRLTLPHPGVLERRFVALPLVELDPAIELPDGTLVARALERLDGQRVEPVGPL